MKARKQLYCSRNGYYEAGVQLKRLVQGSWCAAQETGRKLISVGKVYIITKHFFKNNNREGERRRRRKDKLANKNDLFVGWLLNVPATC